MRASIAKGVVGVKLIRISLTKRLFNPILKVPSSGIA